ncbi:hypothetical protein BT69DRAFT_1303013 [Atractiella rhizophila]|nr:hypothetical protein BT69DRAFT_1303013 [Atractiella rhizophila]
MQLRIEIAWMWTNNVSELLHHTPQRKSFKVVEELPIEVIEMVAGAGADRIDVDGVLKGWTGVLLLDKRGDKAFCRGPLEKADYVVNHSMVLGHDTAAAVIHHTSQEKIASCLIWERVVGRVTTAQVLSPLRLN